MPIWKTPGDTDALGRRRACQRAEDRGGEVEVIRPRTGGAKIGNGSLDGVATV
jgi:hypothetical protein